jgi:hypothetical protein
LAKIEKRRDFTCFLSFSPIFADFIATAFWGGKTMLLKPFSNECGSAI